MYNRWSTIIIKNNNTPLSTVHMLQVCSCWLTKMGILFGGGELLLELTVNLWFVSWWGFCCSFNLFFYFEKLHRHTLKTLFNREKHINVLPFFWVDRREENGQRCPPFVPSLLLMWFYPFSVPNLLPLKDCLT